MIRALFLAAVLAALAPSANARTVTATWKNATKDVEGGALPTSCPTSDPCGRITDTNIQKGTCNGEKFGTFELSWTVKANVLTLDIPLTESRAYCFRAKHKNDRGVEGPFSATVVVLNQIPDPEPDPSAPAFLNVSNPVVYQFIGTADRIVLVPVGTLPIGVACDTLQRVNNMYVVPRSKVQWYGSVKPQVVFAQCL